MRSGWLYVAGSILVAIASAIAAPRVPWVENRVIGSPNPPALLTVQRRFPKLTFNHPVDLTLAPSSERWFVLEQGGKLFSFPNRADAGVAELVFDFSEGHKPFENAYGMTLHPRFAENGFIFVCYGIGGERPDGSHVSRFKVRGTSPPTIDVASETVIVRWPTGSHNGCCLAFGNDGLLYISTGDSANPDPPDEIFKTGQDIGDLMAGILRVDVDRAEGTNAYAIPPGNPFVKTPGARPEVYAFGLRNPWRMSFDRATGELWVGDVGWEQWEMIYRVKAGGNYGWSLVEGPNTHVRTDVRPGPGPILPPLIALPHSEAASITGGRVYHGKEFAKLAGAYVYGDWETGKFWALRNRGEQLLSNEELCQSTLKPVCFAEERDGELLILDYNGGMYAFASNPAPPANMAFPRRLSETGLFRELATLAPAPGVVPYRINAGMWNDYAEAERVLGVPGEGEIITAGGRQTIAGRMWDFPSNTVIARTLTLEMKRGEPSSRRRIETQLLHFIGTGWNAYTFRWNAAQTEAEIVASEGTNEVFTVSDAAAPGGRREVPWRFAGRAECLRCHNAWAGETLSFNWAELNTPGAISELARLENLGVLRMKEPPKPLPRLADPLDDSLASADRARAWLHVNCAGCHRDGAGGGVPARFNFDQPLARARVLDAKPVRGDFGIRDARIVAPGEPYRSILFYRINTEGASHMPHLGSRLTDETGAGLVRDWIRELAPHTNSSVANIAKLTDAKRREALEQLLGDMSGCLALLGESTEPALRNEIAIAAAGHTNALVRELFQRLLPPDQRRHTLGQDFIPDTVLKLSASAERGRELFSGTAQCARCHVCEGAGRAFGPDLSGIGRKYTRAQLLEQIVKPSLLIAPEFKTTIVTLRGGEELSGFIRERSATSILLRDESLVEHRVKLSDVENTRESSVSAMPEGLIAPLTAQEAADVLEFLASTQPPKR
jgi:putative heme-binding domain-containing protein